MLRHDTMHFLHTIRPTRHERAIRILTPTYSIIGILDATNTLTLTLSRITPKERPRICTRFHSSARLTIICLAGTVWCTINLIVLVVCGEDGEGLLACASVVRAFCGLNSVGSLHSYEAISS